MAGVKWWIVVVTSLNEVVARRNNKTDVNRWRAGPLDADWPNDTAVMITAAIIADHYLEMDEIIAIDC